MEDRKELSMRYTRTKDTIAFIGMFIPIAFLLAILLSGFCKHLAGALYRITDNFYLVLIMYVSILGVIIYLLELPLNFYNGFTLEHKFKLSNETLSHWVGDEIKRSIISVVFFFAVIFLVYFALRNFPDIWWLIVGAASAVISLIINQIFPILLIPIFFKQTPLKDETLKNRLIELSKKAGTFVRGIFEIDLSKKTKKGNAALCGIGRTRRIILGDTILKDYTPEEIELVLAHEMGHHKLNHIWKSFFMSTAATFMALFFADWLLKSFAALFHLGAICDISGFPILALGVLVFDTFASPLSNTYMRRLERAADIFALKLTGKPREFISMMEKLSSQNLRLVDPGKLAEVFLYNHPPVSKRIKLAEEFLQRAQSNH